MTARIPSLLVRRSAVIVMYGSAVAAAVTLNLVGNLTEPVTAIAIVGLLIACFVATLVLFRGTYYWRWGNSPDRGLDEYQVVTRNRAYLNAYRVLATLGLLVLLVTRIGGDTGFWGQVTELQKELFFWSYFLIILTLPAAILAWADRPLKE